jgi:hypothetical protein
MHDTNIICLELAFLSEGVGKATRTGHALFEYSCQLWRILDVR